VLYRESKELKKLKLENTTKAHTSREAWIETHQVSHCEDLSFFCTMKTNVTLEVETSLLNPYVSVVEKWFD
jgi:hypothetical protein